MTAIEVRQINLHRRDGSSVLLSRWLNTVHTAICLIQEPWTCKSVGLFRVCGLNGGGRSFFYTSVQGRPRACVVTKGLVVTPALEFTSPDLAVVKVSVDKTSTGQPGKFVLVASAYLPGEVNDPPSPEVRRLTRYCEERGMELIMGMDSNAHHPLWGSKDTNPRGEALLDFLVASNLQLINRGNVPTFVVTGRDSVIDITVSSPRVENNLHNWRVLLEPTLSDHRAICFTWSSLALKAEPIAFRNPRNTNWPSYCAYLRECIKGFPGRYGTAFEIESANEFITRAITLSYEWACPSMVRTLNKGAPFWNKELENLSRENRRLFNRAYKAGRKGVCWELFKAHNRQYKSAIERARKKSWINFCEEVSSVPEAARLHKILSKKRGPTDGQLLLDSGVYSSDDGQALGALLGAHAPGFASTAERGGGDILTGRADWALASRVVTSARVEWAVHEFAPYKTPGVDGLIPILLQKGLEFLRVPLTKLFRACIAVGYVPEAWRNVKVIYIPKSGRAQHVRPKDYRPISLTSFLLKCLEKLVDRYIRDMVLGVRDLHVSQHAYRVGRSTVSALHCLVAKIEKGLEQKEFVLGAFLDIQGAFDSVPFATLKKALVRYGVPDSLQRWIWNVLTSRNISATWKSATVVGSTDRGCPQGGVLSPLLWCLVVDDLLVALNSVGVWCQAYADDVAILIGSVDHGIAVDLMEQALGSMAVWCGDAGLSVNASKTELVLFTRRYKVPDTCVEFGGVIVRPSETVKYLGVILDGKLLWGPHVANQIRKATVAFWSCRGCFNKTWGLKPQLVGWFYTAVVRPLLLYAAAIWWPRTELLSVQASLSRVQRMALLGISGAMRSTPTAALEVALGFAPLHICVQEEALLSAYRLAVGGLWRSGCSRGHASVWSEVTRLEKFAILTGPQDCIPTRHIFSGPPEVIIPRRDEWEGSQPLRWKGPVWFTDGSKTEEGVGAGFTRKDGSREAAFTLESHNTVFQAEVFAIKACLEQIAVDCPLESHVYICVDSQAALRALCSSVVVSKVVLEARSALCEARGRGQTVHLVWVPGHSGVPGNERADYMAGEGSSGRGVRPVPSVGTARVAGMSLIKSRFRRLSRIWWVNMVACRQAKELIGPGLNPRVCKGLLELNRSYLRRLIGVLTGHCRLRYHLCKIRVENHAVCRFCGNGEESSSHILCACDALIAARFTVFGKGILAVTSVRDMSKEDLLLFLKKAGVFDVL